MENILECKDLSKRYLTKKALNNINLEIKTGRIIGILGSNGSGKTTLLKIIAGILQKSSGSILIDGEKPSKITKAKVSYLPDKNYLYKWMKINDAANLFRDFYLDFDENKFNKILEFMKLSRDMNVKDLSKGMYEKLSLALVLSRKAKLYILDEPLGGVDPVAREQILDTIIENCSDESSMIITTHLVGEIERIFEDVVFLKDGEIVLKGDAEKLRTERQKSINEIYKDIFSC